MEAPRRCLLGGFICHYYYIIIGILCSKGATGTPKKCLCMTCGVLDHFPRSPISRQQTNGDSSTYLVGEMPERRVAFGLSKGSTVVPSTKSFRKNILRRTKYLPVIVQRPHPAMRFIVDIPHGSVVAPELTVQRALLLMKVAGEPESDSAPQRRPAVVKPEWVRPRVVCKVLSTGTMLSTKHGQVGVGLCTTSKFQRSRAQHLHGHLAHQRAIRSRLKIRV